MTEQTENIEFVAPEWTLGHRIAARIAELPPDRREDGLAICESVLREAAAENASTDSVEALLRLQMRAIRSLVRNMGCDQNRKV